MLKMWTDFEAVKKFGTGSLTNSGILGKYAKFPFNLKYSLIGLKGLACTGTIFLGTGSRFKSQVNLLTA
jgi:hypothetical protein